MLDSSRNLGHPSLCGLFSKKDLCEQKGCGGPGSFMWLCHRTRTRRDDHLDCPAEGFKIPSEAPVGLHWARCPS